MGLKESLHYLLHFHFLCHCILTFSLTDFHCLADDKKNLFVFVLLLFFSFAVTSLKFFISFSLPLDT